MDRLIKKIADSARPPLPCPATPKQRKETNKKTKQKKQTEVKSVIRILNLKATRVL
jgi:hypothetical protein